MSEVTTFKKIQDEATRIRILVDNIDRRRKTVHRHLDSRKWDLFVAAHRTLPWQKKVCMPFTAVPILLITLMMGGSLLHIFFSDSLWMLLLVPLFALLAGLLVMSSRYERRLSLSIKSDIIKSDGLYIAMSAMISQINVWLNNEMSLLSRVHGIQSDEVADALLADMFRLKNHGWQIYDAASDLVFLDRSTQKETIPLVDLAKKPGFTDSLRETLSPLFAVVDQKS